MTPPTPDDWLSSELARLPGAHAGEGFTRSVMARLERPARRRRAALGWAVAAAAVAVLAALVLPLRPRPVPPAELAERAEALRREHDALLRELENLRELADETAPVLYLDSDERYDYVVDLRPVLIGSAGALPGTLPAAHHPDNP